MTSKNDPIHKRLAEFAEENGFTFVGIATDKEVFLSFTDKYTNEDIITAKQLVKEQFGEEITTIATVVSIELDEVTRMVDGLNEALEKAEEEEEKSKPQILDIGSF
jgi:hypothetical protein